MQLTGVLLVVGPAQPARLNAQQSVVGADRRQFDFPLDEPAWSVEDERVGPRH
jgi:hypothetical protein